MDKFTQGGGHRASTSIGALLSGMGGVRPVSMEVPAPVKLKKKENKDAMEPSTFGDIGAMAEAIGWSTDGWGKEEEPKECKEGAFKESNGGDNNAADKMEYDEEADAEWFKQESKRLSEDYGGDFISVKYMAGERVGYYCELCYAEMNAKCSLDSHCAGMKHLKKKNLWEKNKSNKKGGNGSEPRGGGRGNNWRGKNAEPRGKGNGPRGHGGRGGGTKCYDHIRPDREDQYARDGRDHGYPHDPYAHGGRVDRSQLDDPYARDQRDDPYARYQRDHPYARDQRDDVYGRGRDYPYPERMDDRYPSQHPDDRHPEDRYPSQHLDDRRPEDRYPSQHSDDSRPYDRHPRPSLGSPDDRYPSRPRTPPAPPPPASSRQDVMTQKISNCSMIDEEDVALATNVIFSLIKSLKAFHIGYGQPDLAALITETELNMITVKALHVGKKVLGGGHIMGQKMPSPLNEAMRTSSLGGPRGLDWSPTAPREMDSLFVIGDSY